MRLLRHGFKAVPAHNHAHSQHSFPILIPNTHSEQSFPTIMTGFGQSTNRGALVEIVGDGFRLCHAKWRHSFRTDVNYVVLVLQNSLDH
jgi:hypothetical protein